VLAPWSKPVHGKHNWKIFIRQGGQGGVILLGCLHLWGREGVILANTVWFRENDFYRAYFLVKPCSSGNISVIGYYLHIFIVLQEKPTKTQR